MEEYTREQIEKRRKEFESKHYKKETVVIDGVEYQYYVLPQSLNSKLPDFALRLTGNPEDGYVFGVSESVPENFRPHWAGHEIDEFLGIGNVPKRCRLALEKELDKVPDEIKKEYVLRRRDFFQKLIDYSVAQNATEDVPEYRMSLAYLDQWIRLLK